jgi:hypothetical protein
MVTMTATSRVAAAATLLALAACERVPTGELGNGEFQYSCTGAADSACGSGSSLQSIQLPAQVAVGASFSVSYSPTQNNDTTVEGSTGYTVVPASPIMAQGSGGVMVAQRQGYVALLARHNGTQNVDDYVHLVLTPIARLVPSSNQVTLSAGDTQTVALRPLDAQGGDLAGQIACAWSITGSAGVVTLEGSNLGGSVSMEGTGAGTTTVHAVCGGATVDVDVTVRGSLSDGGTNG